MSTEDNTIELSEVPLASENEPISTEQNELLVENETTKEQNLNAPEEEHSVITEPNEQIDLIEYSHTDETLEKQVNILNEVDELCGEHSDNDITVEKSQQPLEQVADIFVENDNILAEENIHEPQPDDLDFLTELNEMLAKQNKSHTAEQYDIPSEKDEFLLERNISAADPIVSEMQGSLGVLENEEDLQEPSTSLDQSQSIEELHPHSPSSNIEEIHDHQNEEDEEEKKSEVGELIADIFGESDEEETEEPAHEEGVERAENTAVDEDDEDNQLNAEEYLRNELGDEEEDNEEIAQRVEEEKEIVSDFDLIMQKRKEENQRRRRRKRDYDFINNNDDLITDLLKQMENAAKEDAELNSMKLPATRKRSLLKTIVTELKKADLVSAFIECGVINHMAEWLSLLPDKSLPSLEIRTEFLKLLQTFPTLDHQILRSSNIGKAVMLLLKHPKETKENKECARKLINEWARPIFNLQTDYRSVTKDERMKRDYDHMPSAKKRRLSMEGENQSQQTKTDEKVLGPGDKGFIGRARVPRPSTRDYVVRPKWNVETEFRRNSSKKPTSSEMDKKIREIKMRTASNKATHAVSVSIGGRKM